MSTVADVVIGLGLERGEGVKRILTILKARGIAHDLRVRELIIEEGGIRLR